MTNHLKVSEARIIEVEEYLHHKTHKGMKTMGALVVEDVCSGRRFRITSGFPWGLRNKFWRLRGWLYSTGVVIQYTHFLKVPIYLGIRENFDSAPLDTTHKHLPFPLVRL